MSRIRKENAERQRAWPYGPSDLRRLTGIGVVVTATYVIAARLGFQVAFIAEQVTTVWAPTGIALAALLLWGRRLWPAVWVGAWLANAQTVAPLWTAAFRVQSSIAVNW